MTTAANSSPPATPAPPRPPAPARDAKGRPLPRFNALKHGILARHLVVAEGRSPETGAELARLHAQFRAELAPVGLVEELLVERLLVAYWRHRRIILAERFLLQRDLARNVTACQLVGNRPAPAGQPATADPDTFLLLNGADADHLARYEGPLEKEFYRALRELLALQRQHLNRPADPAADPAPPALNIHVARLQLQPPAEE